MILVFIFFICNKVDPKLNNFTGTNLTEIEKLTHLNFTKLCSKSQHQMAIQIHHNYDDIKI